VRGLRRVSTDPEEKKGTNKPRPTIIHKEKRAKKGGKNQERASGK